MKRLIGKTVLFLAGWSVVRNANIPKKCVMIAAPHTSNWDLVFMLALGYEAGIHISWLGKHSLFEIPLLGRLLTWLGGIPIRRHEHRNVVHQMADRFAETDRLILAVQPEGTRKRAAHWRSGFYHIALTAKVPLLMAFVDYAGKQGGFGPVLKPTGDMSKDLEPIRQFYSTKGGKYPELFGDIRFRDDEMTDGAPWNVRS